MVEKRVFIEYREDGVLTTAFEVKLASEVPIPPDPEAFGVKIVGSNDVVYPFETATDNPSTGLYEKTLELDENNVYAISWRVTPSFGDKPKYVVQQVGPFDSGSGIRAVADRRGSFIQHTRGTLFLRVTDIGGVAQDPSVVTCTIRDLNGNVIHAGVPERASTGFFAFDWDIDANQATGAYEAVWSYKVDSPKLEVQEIVVSQMSAANPPSLYAGRILEFRISLEMMISGAQTIPVYRERARPSVDNKTFAFTFNKWNQSPGSRVYLNKQICQQSYTINYFKGSISFDDPLTEYDTVEVDYNFRWFSDEELDRFLSNAVGLVNMWPPVQRGVSLYNADDRFIPLILYGAAVDAIRNLMMRLQFQEPQMVFGGPEGAAKAYANFEGLKKNYEETWNKAIEQKKNGPYVGLTRTIVTPEFALPGGRSRWFRYMFSGGSG